MSIGTSPNPLIRSTTPGLETQKWGGIITEEETGLTSREGVYAGGDAVTGAATVILAMGAGKTAAKAMDDYIRTIEEEYTRTHCRGGDTLLQMARQKKETGGYGG